LILNDCTIAVRNKSESNPCVLGSPAAYKKSIYVLSLLISRTVIYKEGSLKTDSASSRRYRKIQNSKIRIRIKIQNDKTK